MRKIYMYWYKPHDQQSERAKHSMDRIIQKLLPASRLVISPLKIVIITMIIWTSFTRVFYNCHCDKSIWFAKSFSIQYFIAIANTPTSSSPSHASSSSKTQNKNQDTSMSAGILVSPRIPVLPSWGRWRIQGLEPWMPLVVQEILSWLLLSQHIDRSHNT